MIITMEEYYKNLGWNLVFLQKENDNQKMNDTIENSEKTNKTIDV